MRYLLQLMAIGLSLCASATLAEEAGEPLKVCILSGCNTYDSEESLPPFQQFLEENYNVRCTRIVRRADGDLPGLQNLDECNVALVFIKRMQLSGEQLERFKTHATSGKPIVAVRTASHAVQTWLDFDREVLGGNYQGHHPVGPFTTIEVAPGAEKHSILQGVELIASSDSLYKNAGHADNIDVLLSGKIPGQLAEPLAWIRVHNHGRIFYTSLGGQETFQNESFRRMLANALFWTAGRDVEMKNR